LKGLAGRWWASQFSRRSSVGFCLRAPLPRFSLRCPQEVKRKITLCDSESSSDPERSRRGAPHKRDLRYASTGETKFKLGDGIRNNENVYSEPLPRDPQPGSSIPCLPLYPSFRPMGYAPLTVSFSLNKTGTTLRMTASALPTAGIPGPYRYEREYANVRP
jgi:hypothetical protein